MKWLWPGLAAGIFFVLTLVFQFQAGEACPLIPLPEGPQRTQALIQSYVQWSCILIGLTVFLLFLTLLLRERLKRCCLAPVQGGVAGAVVSRILIPFFLG